MSETTPQAISTHAEYTTTEARAKWAEVVERVYFKKERVVITRQGKPAVALIHIEDLEYLEHNEAIDDEEDARTADEAHERIKAGQEKLIPLEEVLDDLGLR